MPNKITIDTNIFIHLTNPENNPDSHIDQLLIHLAKSDHRLCVNSTSKIANEYKEKLGPRLARDETGFAIHVLRYWIRPEAWETVETDATDLLMRRIRQAIPEPDEHADRAFVYVSCRENCCLVSNDEVHIVGRRGEIKSKTRGLRGGQDWAIHTSVEAVEKLVRQL